MNLQQENLQPKAATPLEETPALVGGKPTHSSRLSAVTVLTCAGLL